jgi:hypothetical protein
MTKFDTLIHTPQALAEEIATIHDMQPSVRVVGSIGRSAVYGRLLGDPLYEFNVRGQGPLHLGNRPRDIDILGNSDLSAQALTPFEVDAEAYSRPYFKFVPDGNDWFLVGEHHNFAEPLRPEVMEPFEGQGVFDIPTITLPPKTHTVLYGLQGRVRNKDIRTQALLKEVIDARNDPSEYPEEFLTPLKDLIRLNHRSLYLHSQNAYRRFVPNTVRTKAVPLMKTLKKLTFS